MKHDRVREGEHPSWRNLNLTRRRLLQGALATGGVLGFTGRSWPAALGRQAQGDSPGAEASSNLARMLAQRLNRTRFEDLPPFAVEHAKMIVASTLASAAFGSDLESANIIRDLATEHAGRPDATIWFDGSKLPVHEVARVNAMLSDSAASDDSDIRNTAHYGTALASVGIAMAERGGATGRDLLLAIVTGYEAAGRLADARVGGRGGIHASQVVGFAGAVAAGKLLNLTDDQMASAIGLAAFTMGGLSIGTFSWARQYMGANAAFTGAYSALVAGRGYTVNENVLEPPGGWIGVYGGGDADNVTGDREEWDIVRYLAIKLWPGAHPFSGTVEAAVNAIREAGVLPGEVARILISGPNRTNVGGSRRPQNYAEGITSLPYFVASAVADREFSWIHATPEKMFATTIYPLIDMVEIDPSPPEVRYEWNWGGTVTIVTRSGTRYTSAVDAPRGSGPRGIEWNDVDAKYRSLMPAAGLSASRIDESLELIHNFERVDQVSELMDLLS